MRDLITEETCGGFALRRLHAGEIAEPAATAMRAHLATCERCTRAFGELDRERAAVEAALPLADFEAGVRARLARARAEAAPSRPRRSLLARAVPIAAAASVAVVASALLLRHPGEGVRIKGSAVELIVGGTSTPRPATDGEQLAPGERVRIRVVPTDDQRYGLAISVDREGRVDPLYDESGRSLSLRPGAQVLDGSLEFQGEGAERVYVILSSEPLATGDVARRAEDAFRAAGSVEAMGPLPGVPEEEQTSTLLHKP